jgi:hypothetical protein
MVDDLFFIGAGINLAQEGTLSNPLISRQAFPSDLFFVQPPLHSYVIAGWLFLFPVATNSLTLLQLLFYLLSCWGTIAILRNFGAPSLCEWLVPVGIAMSLLPLGFRPEPLAICLTLLGYVAVVNHPRQDGLVCFGFVLMLAGASTAPRLSLFSVAFVFHAAFLFIKARGSYLRLCLAFLTAALVVLAAFSLMIGFRWWEFIHTFTYHASARLSPGPVGAFTGWLQTMAGLSIVPTLLAVAFLFTYVMLFKLYTSEAAQLAGAITCAFALTVLMCAIGHGSVWYVVMTLFLLGGVVMSRGKRLASVVTVLLLPIALLVGNTKNGLEIYGLITGKISHKCNKVMLLQSLADYESARNVLIDSHAARFIFDYKLPPNSYDWTFSAPFPKMIALGAPAKVGDVYVLGPGSMSLSNKRGHQILEPPQWRPILRGPWSFYSNPRVCFLLAPEPLRLLSCYDWDCVFTCSGG